MQYGSAPAMVGVDLQRRDNALEEAAQIADRYAASVRADKDDPEMGNAAAIVAESISRLIRAAKSTRHPRF